MQGAGAGSNQSSTEWTKRPATGEKSLSQANKPICSILRPGDTAPQQKKAAHIYTSCFKSVIAPLPSTFPISYWCLLLKQIDLALNIVQPCRQNPKLSACAVIEGEFNFGSTPIAPPGTEMLMYVCPENRRSFGHNANKAWYIGPCLKHYRTIRSKAYYLRRTRSGCRIQ